MDLCEVFLFTYKCESIIQTACYSKFLLGGQMLFAVDLATVASAIRGDDVSEIVSALRSIHKA